MPLQYGPEAALLQATDYPDRLDQINLREAGDRATRMCRFGESSRFAQRGFAPHQLEPHIARAGDAVSLTQRVVPSAGGTIAVGLNIKDFSGLLTALASQGKVNVMASPTVNALNNEPAIMRVGTQDVFFKTTTQTDGVTGRILQTTVEPQAITEGVVLSVTPQIAADGMINMSITPSLTERTGQATSRSATRFPSSASARPTPWYAYARRNDRHCGIDGRAAAPRGRKVPFFGDLPGIGAVFRGETTSRRRPLGDPADADDMTPARLAQSVAGDSSGCATK